ncbi:PSD1 and planctomycete cytochrome C domain-containing protein [Verrucomicrobia bacterium]|nr:PSD1 and planctomycete cytochrome C domain-containing protein [Verrucomicrobiota bacterium]
MIKHLFIILVLFDSFSIDSLGRPENSEPINFNRDVRPILSDNCWSCHGPDKGNRKAKLRLDISDHSKSGVIIPGNALESTMIERILSNDADEVMPPIDHRKKLTVEEKEILTNWINQGAKWEDHWAWISPSRSKDLKTKDAIDSILEKKLNEENLNFSETAPRHVLIRRLSYDLRGLPPSTEEVKDFEKGSLDEAISRLSEKFLASQAYGERMAVNWLDLVRYADTNGYHADIEWKVSPYRDYIIDAFNGNKPFDQFTIEQIAGDLLPEASMEQKVAAGYNRLNMKSTEFGIQDAEYLAKYAADRVRTTATTWLGVTVGCAECHDHKFDPFTIKDFYSFAAFFADIKGVGYYPSAQKVGWGETIKVLDKKTRIEVSKLENEVKTKQSEEDQKLINQKIEELKKQSREMLATVSVKPRMTRVLPRGDWMDQTGEIVNPALPTFLSDQKVTTRKDLAQWIVSRQNPLTARVYVNRLWKMFFGTGISNVLDDIGSQGEWPSHPELLDWLAIEFMESGWDIKHMVKLIVNSKAYRQSSYENEKLRTIDPENRLIARQSSFRIDAEFIRDNALSVSGLLVNKIGGPSVKPYQPSGYWENLNFPRRTYKADSGQNQYRRGLYTHWQRQFLHPALIAFDAPSREECTANRPRSNTPLAALVMLNDPTQVESARGLAQKILANQSLIDDKSKIQAMVMQVLSRQALDDEITALKSLLKKHKTEFSSNPNAAKELVSVGNLNPPENMKPESLAPWISVGRALLNLHETITRY